MQKAQGALEYLLLIGGAVLVAVIVITLLLGLANQGQTDTQATIDSGLSLIEQKRNEIIGGAGANDYVVTFTADNLYSIGNAPPMPLVTNVIMRINGIQVGPSMDVQIVPIGVSALQTYSITIPKNEINPGTGPVTKTLELYYDPAGCYAGCSANDINLRVKTISVTNTNWATADWKYKTLITWDDWENGDDKPCYYHECLHASLVFD